MSLSNPNRPANGNSPRKAHRAWMSVAAAVERAMMVNGMNETLVPERVGAVYLFDEMSNPGRKHYHKAQLVVVLEENNVLHREYVNQMEKSNLPSNKDIDHSLLRLSRWIRGGDPFVEFLTPEVAALRAAHDANIKITLLASRPSYIQGLVGSTLNINPTGVEIESPRAQAERSLFARVVANGYVGGKLDLTKALDARTIAIKTTLKNYRASLSRQALRDFMGSGLSDVPQLAVLRKFLGLNKKSITREQKKWPKDMDNVALLKKTSELQPLQDSMVISLALGNNAWDFCRSVFGEKMANLMGKLVLGGMDNPTVRAVLEHETPQAPVNDGLDLAALLSRYRDNRGQNGETPPNGPQRPTL